MSFVPAPQQANAAGAKNAPSQLSSTAAGAADAATETADKDLLFKLRTFDVFWVEKSALMYRDGYDKVRILVRKALTRRGHRVVNAHVDCGSLSTQSRTPLRRD